MKTQHFTSKTSPVSRTNSDLDNQPRNRTSLYGASIEYGLHCLLWLVSDGVERASSRDLAELQGVPPAMLAKIMSRMEKAGIVKSTNGISGGYTLARSPEEISVLAVIDAIEGKRQLFDCKDVREGCVLFGGTPPAWSSVGVCGIHRLMLRAEQQMRAELARSSLADLARNVPQPQQFNELVASWIQDRSNSRHAARNAALKQAPRKPRLK
ncbi:RrF2 family transcriptional regulator [Thalassospira sp.]|uniref:RrF2 family transcriptional regulator n=1 Tax=Thalassospira sp. TaxID=1912094 RepID=UPI003AA86234